MRFLSNSLCALSIFGISKIPTHCWKKASVTWPFSASGLLSMKIVFYLPVNTDKPKLIAVLVFFFLNDCLIYRSNFCFRKCHENSFLPTSKHWQAKINRCLGFFFERLPHSSLKFRLSKMSWNETPSWLRSQNSE